MYSNKPATITWRQRKELLKNKKWKQVQKELNNKDNNAEDTSVNNMTESILSRAAPFLKTAPSLSIALPGSILDNAQSEQLRSHLASQVARAACIYNISEVIIYDDICDAKRRQLNYNTYSDSWRSCQQLAKILEYLECPQYLRKTLFPMCDELKYAGILNPLDAPHHLRSTDDSPYREGVVIEKVSKSGTKSLVDIGLTKPVRIDQLLTPDTRVTLKLYRSKKNKLRGIVVSRDEPTKEEGLYWGYSVRLAKRLSDVFTETPFDGEYDLTLGTSDKGEPWSELTLPRLTDYKHGLIVFGGVKGLEFALSNDNKLSSVEDVSNLFDAYVNTCRCQGARTIRTEEALLISLAVLTHKLGFS